ncbi:MAG: SPOR domain-containing protein [Bacteroidaceae bacterium]|nr:SPOR domain-containing protein [Bacteroidaceae bacterium]
MIELSKHIESLLLRNNCVIVPDLGGFVTQYIPARFVSEEALFLPPYRSVGFNPQLTLNDGLLVQSYMQAYDTSYPETLKLINRAVGQVKSELRHNGEFDFHGIGRLTLGMGGQYNFEPLPAGVLSPELYALDSFRIKRLEVPSENPEEKKLKTIKAEKKPRKENSYTLRINKEMVNYVAAAVVAVFFYFLWATPITGELNEKRPQAASVMPMPAQVKKDAPVTQQTQPSAIAPTTQETLQATEVPTSHQAEAATERFTLVLLCKVPLENAQEYIASLQAKGVCGASIHTSPTMLKVIYGNYATDTEAYAAARELRSSYGIKGAWVMKMQQQ